MCLQALDLTQRNAGYTSLEHSVPVLCFGEGKDMELSLCTESNSLPLATQVIQFGQFWRLKRVGQARAIFPVSLDQVESSQSKTLTLKIQQAGSQLLHETNFVLAD
ncbi:hypothetical protein GBAR_LOCUS25809 [Geodia barretti]|uniref:Uncharacterized protein n=1 Tax=Geodia barretti TaxID=519541 RepID=A0AA35XDC4_GEOBA|nr:hypothetical protein GBAR_LOCUS25809 [Geodia barretti]